MDLSFSIGFLPLLEFSLSGVLSKCLGCAFSSLLGRRFDECPRFVKVLFKRDEAGSTLFDLSVSNSFDYDLSRLRSLDVTPPSSSLGAGDSLDGSSVSFF